jgi:hypothetical protein
MEQTELSANAILAEAVALGKQHIGLLAATAAAIAVGYSALDWLNNELAAAGGQFGISIVVTVLAQYLVIEQLLADRMAPERQGQRRYLSLFVSGVLTGLAIVLGLVFLILPGIYLAARWLGTSAFVVAEGQGATEAMTSAWQASEKSQGAHIVATIASAIPLVVALAVASLWAVNAEGDPQGGAILIVANILTGLSSVVGWLVAAAAYRVSKPGQSELESVFA